MTSGTATRRLNERQGALAEAQGPQLAARRRQRLSWTAWGVGLLVLTVVVALGLLTSRPTASDDVRTAPDFTLPASDGSTVSLADHRGEPVVLYFNEGAGCDSCLLQMAEIEKDPAFADAGITVLPIVMNTAEQINADRERLGVTTPFLIDDGTVSEAYGALGAGMHQGLPGHGFVLVDADGRQQWYGNYPSMWLAPADLLREVTSRLADGHGPAATDSTPHADADTDFAQMMVVHHEGALEMAELAVERAATAEVRALGARIADAQGPEIELMSGWLETWGEESPHAMDHGGMTHVGMEMEGMEQEEVMAELSTLEGADFDRRFLELMTDHHRGAVTMAETVVSSGEDADARELAEKIIADQTAEITEMQELLAGL